MTKFLGLGFAFFLSFAPFGCRSATETRTENSDVLVNSTEPSKIPTVSTKPEQTIPIDVAKLTNRLLNLTGLSTNLRKERPSRRWANSGFIKSPDNRKAYRFAFTRVARKAL